MDSSKQVQIKMVALFPRGLHSAAAPYSRTLSSRDSFPLALTVIVTTGDSCVYFNLFLMGHFFQFSQRPPHRGTTAPFFQTKKQLILRMAIHPGPEQGFEPKALQDQQVIDRSAHLLTWLQERGQAGRKMDLDSKAFPRNFP